VLVVTGGAALAGWLLVQTLEVVPLATLLAVLATALLLHLTRLKCPPAYGLALLPFVIPTPPQTYALLTLAGTAWLLLVVELHRGPVSAGEVAREGTPEQPCQPIPPTGHGTLRLTRLTPSRC
jgi:hypothetical protein